ncbi:MAG: hypothetical protein NC084_06620 [Bacteroides sp.]|nr:hypothetical protein [Eubacterium sp.]MCM1418246.1 hypothetical protein [Roseburia sp.]MCM1462372.1 hypothetical protein [Bacteroides sp.]
MNVPVVIAEGLILCLLLWLMCRIGIRNGAVGMVHFYEKDVQKRAVELGLTTEERIKRRSAVFSTVGLILYFGYIMIAVYWINGARGFIQGFLQSLIIIMIMGVFDKFVIETLWVGHAKAWIIPGTEDLRPYIPLKTHIKKWIVTLIVYPISVAVIAWIMSLILK